MSKRVSISISILLSVVFFLVEGGVDMLDLLQESLKISLIGLIQVGLIVKAHLLLSRAK